MSLDYILRLESEPVGFFSVVGADGKSCTPCPLYILSNEDNKMMEEARVKVNDIIFKCCVRSRCSQKHAVISQKDSYNVCASLCW